MPRTNLAPPQPTPLILASSSPRRADLLRTAGYDFQVVASAVAEPPASDFVDPVAYVTHTAWLKGRAVADLFPNAWVLAADTVASLGPCILGKPTDRDDAERMLRLLLSADHQTLTGVCVFAPRRGMMQPCCWLTHDIACLRFRDLGESKLQDHLESGRWIGKAGAYGLQDNDPWLELLTGSWSNVVGLPMEIVEELLSRAATLETPFR